MELTKTYRFEASHILPKHPGKCSRLHGHSWVLHVSVEGPVNVDTGFVMDFGDISAVVQPLVARLDHRHLGTWRPAYLPYDNFSAVEGLPDGFYPTSENLLWWIGNQLFIREGQPFPWSKLAIEETCTSRATLTRKEFDAKG